MKKLLSTKSCLIILCMDGKEEEVNIVCLQLKCTVESSVVTQPYDLVHPKLDTRISVLCSSVRPFAVRHACTTPPEFWNGLDWRALVESCPLNIGKLLGYHFFLFFLWKKKFNKKMKKSIFLRFFDIFSEVWIFYHFWQF